MGFDSFPYKLFVLLHLSTVIVGFGSSFVWPVLAARARALGPEGAKESFAINSAGLATSKILTTYMIYAAGACGVVLILLSDGVYTFSQTWVEIAIALYVAALLVATFLHTPNLKAMNALQEKLAKGEITPNPAGGPPLEVVELSERGPKAGAFGGLLHALWLLMMIDMIWKPGAFTL